MANSFFSSDSITELRINLITEVILHVPEAGDYDGSTLSSRTRSDVIVRHHCIAIRCSMEGEQ